jgi:hypothetical protein
MSRIVLAGPDRGLAAPLRETGADLTAVDGLITREVLEGAGVETADAVVLTDVGEASAVPVARSLNPQIRVVVYAPDTIPEFARAQVDLAVDPALVDAATFAEEVAGVADR